MIRREDFEFRKSETLQRVDERCREAISMRAYGYTAQEIGRELNLSVYTTKRRIAWGRQNLQLRSCNGLPQALEPVLPTLPSFEVRLADLPVLQKVYEGLQDKEISRELNLTIHMVKWAVQRAFCSIGPGSYTRNLVSVYYFNHFIRKRES